MKTAEEIGPGLWTAKQARTTDAEMMVLVDMGLAKVDRVNVEHGIVWYIVFF